LIISQKGGGVYKIVPHGEGLVLTSKTIPIPWCWIE